MSASLQHRRRAAFRDNPTTKSHWHSLLLWIYKPRFPPIVVCFRVSVLHAVQHCTCEIQSRGAIRINDIIGRSLFSQLKCYILYAILSFPMPLRAFRDARTIYSSGNSGHMINESGNRIQQYMIFTVEPVPNYSLPVDVLLMLLGFHCIRESHSWRGGQSSHFPREASALNKTC